MVEVSLVLRFLQMAEPKPYDDEAGRSLCWVKLPQILVKCMASDDLLEERLQKKNQKNQLSRSSVSLAKFA